MELEGPGIWVVHGQRVDFQQSFRGEGGLQLVQGLLAFGCPVTRSQAFLVPQRVQGCSQLGEPGHKRRIVLQEPDQRGYLLACGGCLQCRDRCQMLAGGSHALRRHHVSQELDLFLEQLGFGGFESNPRILVGLQNLLQSLDMLG